MRETNNIAQIFTATGFTVADNWFYSAPQIIFISANCVINSAQMCVNS